MRRPHPWKRRRRKKILQPNKSRPPQRQGAGVWVGRLVVALFVIVRWRA
eukprot:COSAG06_NODE_63244_length_263_cov_0.140244_1_plen_48_part_10